MSWTGWWTSDGPYCRTPRHDDQILDCSQGGYDGPVVYEIGDHAALNSFDPSGRRILVSRAGKEASWWQPRRAQPPNTFEVVDVEQGEAVHTITTDRFTAQHRQHHAWSGRGEHLLLYNQLGAVSIFRLT